MNNQKDQLKDQLLKGKVPIGKSDLSKLLENIKSKFDKIEVNIEKVEKESTVNVCPVNVYLVPQLGSQEQDHEYECECGRDHEYDDNEDLR